MLHEVLDSKSLSIVRAKALIRAQEGGFEVCGVLTRQQSDVLTMRCIRNLSTEPGKWEIKRESLTKIRKALRAGSRRLVGTFHSHVGGFAYPSERDIEYYPSGFMMMICGTVEERVGMWKPLVRLGKGKLRPVAVCCDSPRWELEEAEEYAQELLRKYRDKQSRS